ncbi:hypothetical protein [Paraliobacillus sp. JSM ZJ581]|uniref:hypothetical protein n=1 Tax=Paraliobacillus sp. JSM ZJ581 TaxID=3342118 RepID=UPI0035A96335
MNWLYVTFLIFIAIGFLLFVYGMKKKSIMSMFLGGSMIIAPIFFAIDWNVFVPFVPPLAMAIAHFVKKKLNLS